MITLHYTAITLYLYWDNDGSRSGYAESVPYSTLPLQENIVMQVNKAILKRAKKAQEDNQLDEVVTIAFVYPEKLREEGQKKQLFFYPH